MFRVSRLLLPMLVIAALAVVVMVFSPHDASGAERGGSKDFYAFGETTAIHRPVTGNAQIVGGTLEVDDVIHGDLVAFGGTITFGPRGRVNGDLIHLRSNIADPEGHVGGRIYPLESVEGAAASLTKTAVVVTLLLVWLIIAVAVTLFSGREIRHSSMEVRSSVLHCFVLGLVAFTSFVLTAIAFSYLVPYVIGIPLLVALGIFAAVTKAYGMIAVFHAVGTLVAGARNRDQLARRKWFRGDLAMVVIGLLLLGAIRLIPVVGTLVWGMASVFGVGVALATRFGRREPWFLELTSLSRA
jgi:hypothetical protein